MNEAYCKSIIKNVENNFKDFQILLSGIPDDTDSEPKNIARELTELFATLTAIEEEVFEMRLKKIINLENPYIPAISPEAVKNSISYQNQSLLNLVQKYLSQKESIIKFLYRVPFFYWDRTGVHELEGHVTFEEFIRRLIKNDNSNISVLKKKVDFKGN
jgi:hypothetical protein